MKVCQSCGVECKISDKKCHSCGEPYLTLAELITEEANYEKLSFKGRCKRIINAKNSKEEFLLEVELIKSELTKKKFLLFF